MARVGEQERERAAESLREHFVSGRLSVEELSQRLDLALRARDTRDLRLVLAELPRHPDLARRGRAALDGASRGLKRAAVVAAVLTLWWAASLVLLVGFVAAVVGQGLTWTVALLFPALWLLASLAAWRVARRPPARPR